MQISSMRATTPNEWSRQHARVLRFLFEYGGKQAMREDYLQLARADGPDLQQPGNSLLLATVRGEAGPTLIGASFVADYGRDAFLIAVHPLYRRKGIGSALLSSQLERLGKIETRVGLNQISLLNLCFKAGLTASSLSKEPTGRILLSLEGNAKNLVRPRGLHPKKVKYCAGSCPRYSDALFE